MLSALLPPLEAAIAPLAAYCARTPAPNRHADHVAAFIDAAADYVAAVEAAEATRARQPDWQAITVQMVACLEFEPSTNPLVLRVTRQLAQPHLLARAAWPLAKQILAATITSHQLRPA